MLPTLSHPSLIDEQSPVPFPMRSISEVNKLMIVKKVLCDALLRYLAKQKVLNRLVVYYIQKFCENARFTTRYDDSRNSR